jgi:hypothetical protein
MVRGKAKNGRLTDKKRPDEELTPKELEEQNGEGLPEREVMSVMKPGIDGIAVAPIEPPETGNAAGYGPSVWCGLAMRR